MRVVHCTGFPGTLQELTAALEAVLAGGPALAPVPPEQAPPERDPGCGQLVVATSGSTAQPRWVQVSSAALRWSAMVGQDRLGGPGQWLLALPAYHIAGLQVLVRAALAGTRVAVLDLHGGFDPDSVRAAAGRLTGPQRRYTALVPTQLARVLDTDPAALTGFDAVLVGGGAVPQQLVQRARTAGVRIVLSYGMTETAGGCVYDGWPLDGVRVRVEGAGSAGTGSTGVGRIELAGPMLATGYLDAPEQTTMALQDGWFRTSDLGRLDRQGRLQILGRADDVIVTGGIKVAPAEVEAVLSALPGVAAACVVGLPDPEWGTRVVAAVVPTDPSRPPDPGALRATARGLLTGAQTPKQVVLLDALPLRGVGKPDRNAIRTLLASCCGQPGSTSCG